MLKLKCVEGYELEIDKNDSRNWYRVSEEEKIGELINYAYCSNDYGEYLSEYLLVFLNFLQNGERDIVVVHLAVDEPTRVVQLQQKGKIVDILNQAIEKLMSKEVLT